MDKKQISAQQQIWDDANNVFYEPHEDKKSQGKNLKKTENKQKFEKRRNNFKTQTTEANKSPEHQIINVDEENKEQPEEHEMKFEKSSSKEEPTETDFESVHVSNQTIKNSKNYNTENTLEIKNAIENSSDATVWQRGLEHLFKNKDHTNAILQDIHYNAKTLPGDEIYKIIHQYYDLKSNKRTIQKYINFVLINIKDHPDDFPLEYTFDKENVKYLPQKEYFLRSKSAKSDNSRKKVNNKVDKS